MKFCKNCGVQLQDEAAFCPNCGTASEPAAQPAPQPVAQPAPQPAYAAPQQPAYAAPQQPAYAAPQQPAYAAPQQPYGAQPAPQLSGLTTAAKIFMIIGCVVTSLATYLIGLAWCLPMTLNYCKKLKTGAPISTGFKVCTLIFVNTIAGILMLCDKDH